MERGRPRGRPLFWQCLSLKSELCSPFAFWGAGGLTVQRPNYFVERFFGLLTDKALRRGVDRSTAELETTIHAYIDATNANPKPFR